MRRISQKRRTAGARSLSRLTLATLVVGALLFAVTPAQGASAEQSCKAGKNKTAGKYAACRTKAEAKLVAGGDASNYTDALDKCEEKFSAVWRKLDDKAAWAGASCPADETTIKAKTDTYTGAVADLVGGGRFVDNEDGTITDKATGLEWEKKTTAVGGGANYGDPHDVDNVYSWGGLSGCSVAGCPNGTAVTDFLYRLNGGMGSCLGGHCDWRLPSIAELTGIVDVTIGSPTIDPIFGPTASYGYWSATTYEPNSAAARIVDFTSGHWGAPTKTWPLNVRAVRTGS